VSLCGTRGRLAGSPCTLVGPRHRIVTSSYAASVRLEGCHLVYLLLSRLKQATYPYNSIWETTWSWGQTYKESEQTVWGVQIRGAAYGPSDFDCSYNSVYTHQHKSLEGKRSQITGMRRVQNCPSVGHQSSDYSDISQNGTFSNHW
jgi:hypothetical protein